MSGGKVLLLDCDVAGGYEDSCTEGAGFWITYDLRVIARAAYKPTTIWLLDAPTVSKLMFIKVFSSNVNCVC